MDLHETVIANLQMEQHRGIPNVRWQGSNEDDQILDASCRMRNKEKRCGSGQEKILETFAEIWLIRIWLALR